jgi:SOS-response transcriptional repressor LexA
MDNASIGAAVRRLRQSQNLTLEKLATDSKVNEGNLSKIERGVMGWSLDTITNIANALRLSVPELFAEAERGATGSLHVSVSIPIIELDDIREGRVPLRKAGEHMRTTASVGPKAFAFRYKGAAMPEFRSGELVIVDPDVTPSFGQYVLVQVGGDLLFRKLENDGAKSYLYSTNKQFPAVPLKKHHRIIGVARQAIRDL